MNMHNNTRNKNYKTAAARILLAVAVAASPLAALAQGDKGRGHGNSDGESKSHGASVSVVSQIGSQISGGFNGLGNAFGHLIAPGWAKHVAAQSLGKNSQNQDNQGDDNQGDNNVGNNRSDSDNEDGNGSTGNSSTTVNQDLAPVVNGLTTPTVLDVGQTGTWTVNASDPQNGSLSYAVDWGDNALQPLARIANRQVFVQSATFTHSYANAGDYRATFTIMNSAGLTAQTSATVHVMQSASAAPVISNVVATATSPTNASIAWSTDIRSNSQLWYSASSSSIDTSGSPNAMHRGFVLNHRINLHGLTPSTTYYYVVGSADSSGALSTSSVASFVTPAAATTTPQAPVITSISGSSTVTVGAQNTWTVKAYDPQNEPLTYSIDWGDNALQPLARVATRQMVFGQTATFSHTYNATGTYAIRVTVSDSSGLSTASSTTVDVQGTTTATTTIPLAISNATATVASTSVNASWTTSVGADSEVFFGTSTPLVIGATSTQEVSDATLTTSHSLNVTGLTPNTTYYMVIQSKDASNDVQSTGQFSVLTGM